jgi:rRNA maturation endonuclease Nob1
MDELFICENCRKNFKAAVVRLDKHLRCENCGSDAVISVEQVNALQKKGGTNGEKPTGN